MLQKELMITGVTSSCTLRDGSLILAGERVEDIYKVLKFKVQMQASTVLLLYCVPFLEIFLRILGKKTLCMYPVF